jgi:hypothetical protein
MARVSQQVSGDAVHFCMLKRAILDSSMQGGIRTRMSFGSLEPGTVRIRIPAPRVDFKRGAQAASVRTRAFKSLDFAVL